MLRSTRAIPALCLAFLTFSPLAAQDEGARPLLSTPPVDGSTGATVFTTGCADCHAGDESSRAPGLVALSGMSPNAIVRTLETGRMRRHGAELTREERVAVAEWIAGRAFGEEALPASAYCADAPLGPGEVHWSGWGGGSGESGFRDAASAGLTAADLGDLELAWAFAFPQASEVRSKPAVVGDRAIVGSANGSLYALDLETGCVRWTFEADASIRGAIAIGEAAGTQAALFADFRTNVYAVDAATGAPLWRARAGEHPDHTNTGSVAYHEGRLFVPISSMEIASAMDPSYECCTSSGGVVAFDAAEGEPLWAYWTVAEEPREVGVTETGTRVMAPSGAPVWSSPTVDARRGRLYIGTGENYSRPTTGTSDALIALDLETGAVAWSFQATEGDAWNLACQPGPGFQNCPDAAGPDLDFGMAPILVRRADGSEVLVAGQKSGVVWALDPDARGQLLWAKRVGKGGALGGVHWGAAADGEKVYVPNSDHPFGLVIDPRSGQPAQPNAADAPATGVYAIELGGGEVLWEALPPRGTCEGKPGCLPFFSAAPTAIEGAVLVGSLDGHLRAYSTADGSVLWDVDTAGDFETVNGIPGRGGALDGPGPVVARGTLLVNSGYSLFGQMPGNLLLAYRTGGR